MPTRKVTPKYIADHIRQVLRNGGSAPHSKEVQWFFKEEVQSRGWYTAELRKVAVRMRRSIVREQGMDFLVRVADELFSGRVLEEKILAVFLLEKQTTPSRGKGLPPARVVARPHQQLGRSRCAGARCPGANAHCKTHAQPRSLSLGQGAQSLAPSRSLCSPDPRHQGEDVLPRNHAPFRNAASR